MAVQRDEELAPRQAARLLGISVVALTNHARAGKIAYSLTISGQRRYRRADVRAYAEETSAPSRDQLVEDAVRLYDQGCSIREVAEKFDRGYGVMRRILMHNTTLRPTGARDDPTVAAYIAQGYGLNQAKRLTRWTAN